MCRCALRGVDARNSTSRRRAECNSAVLCAVSRAIYVAVCAQEVSASETHDQCLLAASCQRGFRTRERGVRRER